jgi:hypothetical protein
MVGLQYDIEQIQVRALAGPGIIHLSSQSVSPITGLENGSRSYYRAGVYSEISIAYPLTDRLSTGLTGFAQYYGPITGGILFQVSFAP